MFNLLVKHLVLALYVDLGLKIVAVILLHHSLLNGLFGLVSLEVFGLALNNGTPLVKLTVFVDWVVSLILFLKMFNLLFFIFKGFFDAHHPQLEGVHYV